MNCYTPETIRIAEGMVGKKLRDYTSEERKLAYNYGKGRDYYKGRSTKFWKRGERVVNCETVKPDDVLIMVTHSGAGGGSENLIRVCLPDCLPDPVVRLPGIHCEYADNLALNRSDGFTMFLCHWKFSPDSGVHFYRAIDCRRKLTRFRHLPSWLEYSA